MRSRELIEESLTILHDLNFDVRAITLGLNLVDVKAGDISSFCEGVKDKVRRFAEALTEAVERVSNRYNVKIANRRVAVTPVGLVAGAHAGSPQDFIEIAKALDEGIKGTGVDLIGGFSIMAHRSLTRKERIMLESIPSALSETEAVCSSVNVATSNDGINMEAVLKCAEVILKTAEMTKDRNSFGCAKFVVFSNMPEDNPFMAGAVHGVGGADASINVGISGPGVVATALRELKGYSVVELESILLGRTDDKGIIKINQDLFDLVSQHLDKAVFNIGEISRLFSRFTTAQVDEFLLELVRSLEKSRRRKLSITDFERAIKRAVAKITSIGDLIGSEIVSEIKRMVGDDYTVTLGAIDLSLAPTIQKGDSVAEILKELGVLRVGAPGTTAALAMLIDAVKKGGVLTASYPGGLSGTFIPVSEDGEMAEAVGKGHLSLEKLEALTAVCSVGIDMLALRGEVDEAILAGIIADEMAIGVINNKATAVRIIPVIDPTFKLSVVDGKAKLEPKVVFWLHPELIIEVEDGKIIKLVEEDGEVTDRGTIDSILKGKGISEGIEAIEKELPAFRRKVGLDKLKLALYPEKENLWGEAYLADLPSVVKDNLPVSATFLEKGGRISAPLRSLTN